jgi:hypothetical protein
MLDEKQLEEQVHSIIIDLCEVLYRHGYTMVPVGAMMRMIGVNPDKAADHDDEYFELDETFKKSLEESKKKPRAPRVPTGVTLH